MGNSTDIMFYLPLQSTDHALYEVEIASARKTRTFHSPAYGHREWVSCVNHLPDGSFVSGGMDGKLCLWGKVGQRCVEFVGHGGSVWAFLFGYFRISIWAIRLNSYFVNSHTGFEHRCLSRRGSLSEHRVRQDGADLVH